MSVLVLAALLGVQQAHAHAHHTPPPPETQDEAAEDPHAGHAMPAVDPHAGHATGAAADKLDGIPMTPPPREAGEGPARAAEARFGVAAMERARAQLVHETGDQRFFMVMADRLEARLGGEEVGFLWDAQASYGGDLDKLWIESEGEGDPDAGLEHADLEATWSHAIAPFWDLQLGARQDIAGSRRTWATVGVQGLAPYLFEVDAGAYLSSEGEVTASIEAELDQLVTNRLILQPRGEIVLSAQDIPDLGYGAGVAKVELGARLRYEISREVAPYVGVAAEFRPFTSGGDAEESAVRAVVGVRLWY